MSIYYLNQRFKIKKKSGGTFIWKSVKKMRFQRILDNARKSREMPDNRGLGVCSRGP